MAGNISQPGIGAGGGGGLQVTHYTTAGAHNWSKPTNCVAVQVILIGAGGGGGGGARNTVCGQPRGGGCGSSISMHWFRASDLPASVPLVVGAGGAGGAGGAVTNSNGSPGTDGGLSSFNGEISAPGGFAGRGEGNGGSNTVDGPIGLDAQGGGTVTPTKPCNPTFDAPLVMPGLPAPKYGPASGGTASGFPCNDSSGCTTANGGDPGQIGGGTGNLSSLGLVGGAGGAGAINGNAVAGNVPPVAPPLGTPACGGGGGGATANIDGLGAGGNGGAGGAPGGGGGEGGMRLGSGSGGGSGNGGTGGVGGDGYVGVYAYF
jgi:hypothetical protein